MTVLTDTTQVVFQFHDVIRLLKPPAILENVAGDTDFGRFTKTDCFWYRILVAGCSVIDTEGSFKIPVLLCLRQKRSHN